jgi:two-component system cell cycle response regulator
MKALADLIRERGRRSDIQTRYGGDEIAIIMPESNKSDCVTTLNRLQEEFYQRQFRPDDSADPLWVTFSAGVSSFPQDGVLPDVLIRNADRALYRAKREKKSSTHER